MPQDFEFDRDWIPCDEQDFEVIREIVQGLREARAGEFVPESILDILDED